MYVIHAYQTSIMSTKFKNYFVGVILIDQGAVALTVGSVPRRIGARLRLLN